MSNLRNISSYNIFGQTNQNQINWAKHFFLAKKKQLTPYEDLRPIAALIKQGLLVLGWQLC